MFLFFKKLKQDDFFKLNRTLKIQKTDKNHISKRKNIFYMTYLNLEPFRFLYSLPVKKYRLCVMILEAIENISAYKST